ncbi:MAG: A24 family peptidase [Lachnospiraceae bacterium]|nr:A24 family peptidase [Lachnospiraceae bacterium]
MAQGTSPDYFIESKYDKVTTQGGDFIGLNNWQSILLLLLFLSAFSDLKTDRIPNGFILLGIATGILCGILSGRNLSAVPASVLLAFLLLYPLYKIGVLGAGDVKLFVMIGCFYAVKDMAYILAGAFVIGAVFSACKLVAEQNAGERFRYFFIYLREVKGSGHLKLYGEEQKQDYHTYCKSKIHFAVPVLFSVVCRMGGLF